MGIKKISIIFCLNIVIIFGLMKINFNVAFAGDEISLYDRKGNAVAYIAVDDELTIYLWKGKPVAYLDGEDVYGFNGKHLGWFSKGLIIDHDGNIPCVIKESHPGYTNYEGYKGYKSYKPYKSYKEYSPYKPYSSKQFSAVQCSLFLAFGE